MVSERMHRDDPAQSNDSAQRLALRAAADTER